MSVQQNHSYQTKDCLFSFIMDKYKIHDTDVKHKECDFESLLLQLTDRLKSESENLAMSGVSSHHLRISSVKNKHG